MSTTHPVIEAILSGRSTRKAAAMAEEFRQLLLEKYASNEAVLERAAATIKPRTPQYKQEEYIKFCEETRRKQNELAWAFSACAAYIPDGEELPTIHNAFQEASA